MNPSLCFPGTTYQVAPSAWNALSVCSRRLSFLVSFVRLDPVELVERGVRQEQDDFAAQLLSLALGQRVKQRGRRVAGAEYMARGDAEAIYGVSGRVPLERPPCVGAREPELERAEGIRLEPPRGLGTRGRRCGTSRCAASRGRCGAHEGIEGIRCLRRGVLGAAGVGGADLQEPGRLRGDLAARDSRAVGLSHAGLAADAERDSLTSDRDRGRLGTVQEACGDCRRQPDRPPFLALVEVQQGRVHARRPVHLDRGGGDQLPVYDCPG